MCVQFYSGVNLKIVFKNTRCIKKFSLLTRTALSFTGSQQSRIIYRANCWDCNGLNGKTIKDGFMIGKPKTSRPSLKMTIPQPLLTTSKPLDITSRGITLIFWRRAKQTTIAKSKRLYFKNLTQLPMPTSEVKG